MIVLDTSGILSALDAAQSNHDACRRVLERDRGPFLLSPFVLAELDYLLARHVSQDAQRALLSEVAAGAYTLAPITTQDVEACVQVIDRYRSLRIGLADASLVVLAGRHRTRRILTLDDRHFRAIRPIHGRSFQLLPADG